MDYRLTLNTAETFLNLLKTSFQSGEKVNLLVDDNGLSRHEGFIKSINTSNPETTIEMQDGKLIFLKKIAAVNGIFLPEYGEC